MRDVCDLQRRDLGDAKAGAVGDRQRRLVLEAGGRAEQAGDLVAAQHHRQLARMGQPDQLARKVWPIDRVREEEPQRRYNAVHGRHRDADLALLDLEAAQILRRGRGGRASHECGEPPNVADVVALRLVRKPAHVHIVDQSLAQRADRGGKSDLVHRKLLKLRSRDGLPTPKIAQPKRNRGDFTSPSTRAPSREAGSFFGQPKPTRGSAPMSVIPGRL
jgi:hypothetical protein